MMDDGGLERRSWFREARMPRLKTLKTWRPDKQGVTMVNNSKAIYRDGGGRCVTLLVLTHTPNLDS